MEFGDKSSNEARIKSLFMLRVLYRIAIHILKDIPGLMVSEKVMNCSHPISCNRCLSVRKGRGVVDVED